jgi:hypothetical protein
MREAEERVTSTCSTLLNGVVELVMIGANSTKQTTRRRCSNAAQDTEHKCREVVRKRSAALRKTHQRLALSAGKQKRLTRIHGILCRRGEHRGGER